MTSSTWWPGLLARPGQLSCEPKKLVFAIVPTAGKNRTVCSWCTANGAGWMSKSSGKEPTIDAAFQICGSSLFEAYPDFIEIRIGSMDEAPSSIGAPERENWTKRREHWLSPKASAEQV